LAELDQKLTEEKDKKKDRMVKCSALVSLLLGAIYNQVAAKCDGEGEHPYELMTDYFDEAFIGSDDNLVVWPYELDVNSISEDVDQDPFLQKWDEYIDDHKREYHSCNFVGKRSLDRRCSQRRSLEEWYGNFDLDVRSTNSSSLVDRQKETVYHPTTSPCGSDELDKRFLGFLFDILAAFGIR
jgi:hypothetical protein